MEKTNVIKIELELSNSEEFKKHRQKIINHIKYKKEE